MRRGRESREVLRRLSLLRLAVWDQRGSGKSAASIEPAAAMNMGQVVADTIELTEQSPTVSCSQSHSGGARKALAELTGLGAPPYAGADAIAQWKRCGRWLGEFGAVWHSSEKFDRVGWMLSSIEYSCPEKLRFNPAAARSFDLLYADLLSMNLIEAVPQVEVPVFFAEGRYDQLAPVEVAERYFSSLMAPRKEWVLFEDSAHFPQWEERERFHRLLASTVLPAAAP